MKKLDIKEIRKKLYNIGIGVNKTEDVIKLIQDLVKDLTPNSEESDNEVQ